MADPLLQAIASGDSEMVTCLISNGIAVNDVLTDGRTPLNAAITRRDDVIIAIMLDAEADVEMPDSFRVDCARLQPIHYAARHGHMDLMINFLSRVDVDQPDEGSCTPLHHAAANGHLELVKLLLEHGSDVNWQSNSGRSPLWKAAESGHRELVHTLYASGARLDLANKVGEHVLFEVIKHKSLRPIARDLVHLGIDISWTDIEGNTVLHKACVLGSLEMAEMVIEAGIDMSARNDYGNTALHNAAMFGNIQCMACFLNYGAASTVRVLNNVGQSAMYLAMVHQKPTAITLLHDLGARLTPKELRNFQRYEANRSVSKVQFWDWCLSSFGRPKRLNVMCTAVIRQVLRQPIFYSAHSLPIPVCLQKTILLEEFLNS